MRSSVCSSHTSHQEAMGTGPSGQQCFSLCLLIRTWTGRVCFIENPQEAFIHVLEVQRNQIGSLIISCRQANSGMSCPLFISCPQNVWGHHSLAHLGCVPGGSFFYLAGNQILSSYDPVPPDSLQEWSLGRAARRRT